MWVNLYDLDQTEQGYRAMPEPTHYVLPRGTNSMVKEAGFFNSQKNDSIRKNEDEWWDVWVPVIATSIERARELAAHMTPYQPHWGSLKPTLPKEVAVQPETALYKQCQCMKNI